MFMLDKQVRQVIFIDETFCKAETLDKIRHLWYVESVEMDLSILRACFGGTSRKGVCRFFTETEPVNEKYPDVEEQERRT